MRSSTQWREPDSVGVIRFVAIGLAALVVWTVAAARVHSNERLLLADIVPGAVETLPFGCTPFALQPFDPLCPGLHIPTGIDLAAPARPPLHPAPGGVSFPT